jgi:hypothetical protein
MKTCRTSRVSSGRTSSVMNMIEAVYIFIIRQYRLMKD